MKAKRLLLALVAVGALGSMLALQFAQGAEGKDELKARFEARHPQLLTLKLAGTVGETSDGYVEVVPGRGEAPADLLNAENADRRALYTILAREENSSIEEVAKNNAIFKFRKASLEEWFKGKDGVWRQKKDMLE